MTKKYYTVKKGRKIGIYRTWADAEEQIKGFKGAQFKGFNDFNEAKAYFQDNQNYFINAEGIDLSKFNIVVHTDGGCRNHGNKKGKHVLKTDPAAWAYLVEDHDLDSHIAKTDGEFGKTNNYMEVTAVLKALRDMYFAGLNGDSIEGLRKILFICDSKYALRAGNKKWLAKQAKNGFMIANGELWRMVYQVVTRFDNITWGWVHGHNGEKGNDYVDQLLNQTMNKMLEKAD